MPPAEREPCSEGVDPWSYWAPAGAASAEFKEKGSRFLGHLIPASSPGSAMAELGALRKRYHDATHHCWAYRVGWAQDLKERSGDDGEPSRTAGPPILAAMASRSVSDSILVVVRYFGGVKLGTAGLARAYREAAAGAIGGAQLEERTLCAGAEVFLPYSAQGSLRHLLKRFGVEVAGETFGERWGASIVVPLGRREALGAALDDLAEACRGEIRWKSR